MYHIRLIRASDCAAVLEVYTPYVEKTAYTFEYVPPSAEELGKKIAAISAKYPWLVCEHNGRIIGYAYASTHRERIAYQWSPEATIYISEGFHGSGIAKILYETLFDILRLQGFINVYAGVLLTNERSNRFHKNMGFEEIGIFRKIGYKLGKWHDNLWYQLHLSEHVDNPKTPIAFIEIEDAFAMKLIMKEASKKMKAL